MQKVADISPGDHVPRVALIRCLRRKAWFQWVAILALACTVGLYAAESNHHHKTQASELLCPVCKAIGQGALDLFTPETGLTFSGTSGYFLRLAKPKASSLSSFFLALPQSRAPPRSSSQV